MAFRGRSARVVLGSLGATAVGSGLAVLWAGLALEGAQGAAGPGFDGSAPSPFVVRARRGELAVPSLEEVENMCALLTSCEKVPIPSSLYPHDFQACVKKMTDQLASPAAVNFSLTLRECGLASDSCARLRSCALHGSSPDACKGRGKQSVAGFCDVDGRAMTCWHDEVLAVRDCTRGSEQCIVVDGEATCTLGPCGGANAESQPSGAARCSGSGTHLLRCEKGKLTSLDCSAFGLKCQPTPEGTAGCSTGSPACVDDARRCEAQVAIACYHGHEVRVDCAAGGLVCARWRDKMAVGECTAPAPPPASCDLGDKAQCDAGKIRYCFAGTARTFSCNALGFRGCDAGKGGVRCTP